jgi:hypothetical protein
MSVLCTHGWIPAKQAPCGGLASLRMLAVEDMPMFPILGPESCWSCWGYDSHQPVCLHSLEADVLCCLMLGHVAIEETAYVFLSMPCCGHALAVCVGTTCAVVTSRATPTWRTCLMSAASE